MTACRRGRHPAARVRTAESGAAKENGVGRVSQSQGRPLRLSHGDIVRWRAQLLVTGTCHVWMGAVGSDGYGRIAIRNPEEGARTLTPHQVGARLGYGPIPAGATVLHDCEVRLCCRAEPGHLRVGTQSENMRQAVARPTVVTTSSSTPSSSASTFLVGGAMPSCSA